MFCEDISFLLKMMDPNKPLFIYGHSMGGLTVASFLTNNPHLNIAGSILSAPLLAMPKSVGIDNKKRLLIDFLAPEIDQMLLNPMVPAHLVCSDVRVYYDFLLNRKFIPFISLGLT